MYLRAWKGQLTSNIESVAIIPDKTWSRLEAMRKEPETFSASLSYFGSQNKPLYSAELKHEDQKKPAKPLPLKRFHNRAWLKTDVATNFSWTAGEVEVMVPRCHYFELLMFEDTGSSHLEMFYRSHGTYGEWDAVWRLLMRSGPRTINDPSGLQLWYHCSFMPSADVNKDCRVNLEDLASMAWQWLDCYREPEEACLW